MGACPGPLASKRPSPMLAFTKSVTPKGRPAPAQHEILEGTSVLSSGRAPDHVHLDGNARRKDAFPLQNRVIIRAVGAGWGHFEWLLASQLASSVGRPIRLRGQAPMGLLKSLHA